MPNAKKRLRRGLASLITVGVVLAAVLLNASLSCFLGDKILTVDVTTEGFDEISDESRTLLKDIVPEENQFTIYFLADKDELQSPEFGYSNSVSGSTSNLWGMRYIWELAKEFEKNYSYIHVETLNMRKDAEKLEEFRSTAGSTFTKQDVIIDNYTCEKDSNGNPVTDATGEPIMHHNFRICKRDSFFTTDSSTGYAYAFNGDQRFTSTLLSLAGANPTVYFVVGHGETVGDNSTLDASMTSDYGEAQAYRDLLFKAGFVTKKINLQTDYKELFADDSARLLVVFGATSDFLAGDPENGVAGEIDVMRKFLALENHHLTVFFDSSTADLPIFYEYLWDYWGVRPSGNTVKDSGTNSLSSDGKTFNAAYETNQYSVGTNLTKSLSDLTSKPAAAFSNACVLELRNSFTQNNGFYGSSRTVYLGSTFLTPSSSVAIDSDGETVEDYSKTDAGSLFALSYASRYSNDSREVSNYAVFSGSTGFADAEYLDSGEFCNGDILFYSMRLMARETVPFEIDFKVIQGQALQDVEQTDVVVWTVGLCGVIPLTVLILGTVVFIKRRHR